MKNTSFVRVALLLPLFAATACTTRVDLGTAAALAEQDAEVVPRVATSTAIRTFDKYCYRTRANPGRVVATLKADGYRLLVTDRRNNMFGYALAGRPMVAVIDNPSEPGCLTFVHRDPKLASAFASFVRSRHRNARSAAVPNLDSVWVVPGSPGLTFARDVDGTDELLMLIVQ